MKHGMKQKPPSRKACPRKTASQPCLSTCQCLQTVCATHGHIAWPRAVSPRSLCSHLFRATVLCQSWAERKAYCKHISKCTAGHTGLGFQVFIMKPHLSWRFSAPQGAGLDTVTPPCRSDCRTAWLVHSVIRSDRQMIHIVVSRVFSCPNNPARKGLGVSACPHILLSLNRLQVLNRDSITQALMNY